MEISTRTHGGLPNRCSVCGNAVFLEPSDPPGDAPCPSCGQLLWWFQERFSSKLEMPREAIRLETSITALGADSLDVVELVMDFEEAFDLHLPWSPPRNIRTIEDAIRWLNRHRGDRPAA